MAKKLNLKIADGREGEDKKFWHNYRQSTNVVDRRGAQWDKPTETPRVSSSFEKTKRQMSLNGSTSLGEPSQNTPSGAADGMSNPGDITPSMKSGQSRKVDPDEAVSITNSRY